MAEGRRRDDEEEELRERRELGGPRRARGRAISSHSAADRNERNKPEHRSSSQGPLSSIRAVIKRSSRTSIQSELHRDRRRPEITIVAAEPLRPASWFPGAAPPGLGFPPTPASGPWRPNELVPAELPPSYEQVIKEINQVQVNTTNNNNAAATPRSTSTSATQTDFPEEIDNSLPQTRQASLQPSPAAFPADLQRNTAPLIVFDIPEEQNCPGNPSATRCPVPRPRSKNNLRPAARETNIREKNHQKNSSVDPEEASSPGWSSSLLDRTNDLDSQAVMYTMNPEQSQNSIVSRVKAFEGQTNVETSPALPKKPEITPRTLPPKPAVSSGKPCVAPKPGAGTALGDWDTWTENRLKVTSRQGLTPYLPPQEAGNIPVTKPELPKKPTPGLIRSVNHEILGGGLLAESAGVGKKVPTPAPRPLLPKKSVSSENPTCPSVPPKPSPVPSGLLVSSQAKDFRSLGEGALANAPAPALPSRPLGDIDLISFDDDVLPTLSGNPAEECVGSEMVLDPFQLPTKAEATKERSVQPATTRKPTVIRIPAKPGKCLLEEPQTPPPLPAEKPIGNTYSTVSAKLSNADRSRNSESDHASDSGGLMRGPPRLPPRPANGKAIPTRRPPSKGAPERPPPPKLSATRTSKKLPFSRSSSEMDLQRKQSHLASGLSKAKSQVFKSQDPVLPPRPKPGHPLYKKYMLSVPHGLSNEDIDSQKPTELSCKELGLAQKPVGSSAPHAVVLHDFPAEQVDDLNLTSGEIVYLLEKIDAEWYRGKCRNQTGVFPANYVRVIVDIPEGGNGKRELGSFQCVKGPRCVARFEYIGDQKDELSFSEGEVIILKEYVNNEWAKGEVGDRTGIFPLNFVELLEDFPAPGANISSTKVPPKTKKEASGSKSQDNNLSEEWCKALHSFTAETSDDLAFQRGDRILILERLDADWYRGRLHDREGIFPAVFVQRCAAEAKTVCTPGLKGRKAKALYDFHGENEDELSFKAGDIITGLESVNEEWMSGELLGKSGIFPKNYIQFLQVG
ncbi:SH3 domain-containing protein 19 isoform X2 [Dipodomys spectabilis]|uniref:SH3 domain-containing protein 19 isoform X2 n=1 Tax=Dipodomys spectabilis TaxID=105255 RepID=UPI001C5346E1|nr:SH3 domain-containing protein 19 isoform X2 [Dipodomys spectabilis]